MASDVKILIVDDGTLSSLPVLKGLKKHGFDYIELAINSNCMFDYLDRGHFGLIISNWSRIEMPGTGVHQHPEKTTQIQSHSHYHALASDRYDELSRRALG